MKTTLDISDHLLLRAKATARKEGSSLRALTEEGLELALSAHRRRKRKAFQPVVFKGNGLSPEYQNASWDAIRSAAYEGRGA